MSCAEEGAYMCFWWSMQLDVLPQLCRKYDCVTSEVILFKKEKKRKERTEKKKDISRILRFQWQKKNNKKKEEECTHSMVLAH